VAFLQLAGGSAGLALQRGMASQLCYIGNGGGGGGGSAMASWEWLCSPVCYNDYSISSQYSSLNAGSVKLTSDSTVSSVK